MSDGVRPVTPRGFRDILFEEAAERESVSAAMLARASAWGYGRVETPALERVETLAAGAGALLEGDAFRLFDLDGGLLAMRPEMTVPIARLVASRLRDEDGPFRLSYCADVFREHADYRGQYRQYTQVGAEFVGADGAAADAECVALAVEMLDAAGLDSFDVAVGTVGVLRSLLDTAAQSGSWDADALRALHDRNLVALDALTGADGLPGELRAALRGVPRLRGGREALDACRALTEPCGCAAAVDELEAVFALLEAAGVADRVSVDFGIVRAFDYYTGLVLEASTPDMGLPLGGGGRYDGLLERFGRPMPAAGFALGLERVHIALAEQGKARAATRIDAVLGGDDEETAFAAAAALRREGRSVVLAQGDRAAVIASAARGGVEALWATPAGVESLGTGETPTGQEASR